MDQRKVVSLVPLDLLFNFGFLLLIFLLSALKSSFCTRSNLRLFVSHNQLQIHYLLLFVIAWQMEVCVGVVQSKKNYDQRKLWQKFDNEFYS